MRTPLAVLAVPLLMLVAAPAFAAEPDAPVATASSAEPPMSTAEQIDAFIKSSPAQDARRTDDKSVNGVVGADDRKPHGEVSVGVGTGGYRSVYGRTDIPVGKNGRVSLAFEDTRNGYGYGRGGWYGGPYGGGALGLASPDHQRCDLEGMTPERPLDVRGRCARPLGDW